MQKGAIKRSQDELTRYDVLRCVLDGRISLADAAVYMGVRYRQAKRLKKSVDIGLMSLIGPIGQIRKLIVTLGGLRMSVGQIAEILHDVAELGEPAYEELLEAVRGLLGVHADETGWRENGVNGYISAFRAATLLTKPATQLRDLDDTELAPYGVYYTQKKPLTSAAFFSNRPGI